ncbi:MAG: Lin0512 family protein [Pseudomonadota bacterium]
MVKRRVAAQFGMGTYLRREDDTEAAARAIRDALWRNALSAAELFGFDREDMIVDVEIGAPRPERVDAAALAGEFPYGQVSVEVKRGGLAVPKPSGAGVTLIAHAAVFVSFAMEPA